MYLVSTSRSIKKNPHVLKGETARSVAFPRGRGATILKWNVSCHHGARFARPVAWIEYIASRSLDPLPLSHPSYEGNHPLENYSTDYKVGCLDQNQGHLDALAPVLDLIHSRFSAGRCHQRTDLMTTTMRSVDSARRQWRILRLPLLWQIPSWIYALAVVWPIILSHPLRLRLGTTPEGRRIFVR